MKYITYMFSTIKLKFFIHIELFWITIRESLYKRITFNSIYHSGREYAPRRYWIGSLSTSIRRCQSFSPVRYIAWSPDLRSTWKISCHVIHWTFISICISQKKKKRKICKRSMSNHDRIEYREKLKSIVERTCYEISLVRISKER